MPTAKTRWKTFNVRLSDEMIVELEKIKDRFNTDLGLSAFGHRYTRADVIRSVMGNGIAATNQRLQPLPSQQPTEPK